MKFTSHQSQVQSDKFLKIKDGEVVKGVFRGEIFEYFVKWENGKGIVVGPNGGGKIRFRVNIVIPDGATFKCKVFEFGMPVYDQMEMLNKAYGDLTKIKVAIARKGLALDTTYMLMPLVQEPLAPQVLAKIEAIPLNILDTQKKEEAKPEIPMPDFEDEMESDPNFDELPF